MAKAEMWYIHDQTFRSVHAYVIVDRETGEKIGTVALKHAASGLTTQAFVHLISWPMTRGKASGGGYDKASAAVASAASKIDLNGASDWVKPLHAALTADTGKRWDDAVRDVGYFVHQAV